jgi:hypothetical protein
MQAPAVNRYAGERAISVSVIQLPFFPKDEREPWRVRVPCWGRSTVRDFTGGIRTRSFHWSEVPEIFTTSVGWAARCGQPDKKQIHSRRVNGCAAVANLQGSLCHRYPACAFVPSDRPRALRHTPLRREPGDPGLPFRHQAGIFQTSCASENKKPSGAVGSGGSVERTVDLRLREIVPMSQASAIDRRKAVRSLDAYVVSVVHHRAHVRSRT